MKNKYSITFKIIMAVELVIMVLLICMCFKEKRILFMETSEWEASGNLEIHDFPEGTRGVIQLEGTGRIDEEIVHSDEHRLQAGAYRVTVRYRSESNVENPSHSVKDSAGKLVFYSYKDSSALSTSTIRLDDGATQRTSRLWIRTGKTVEDFRGKILYHGVGKMAIESVELSEMRIWRVMRIVGFFILFAMIDFIYLLFSKDSILKLKKEQKIKICGLSGIIIFTSMLYFTDSLYYGHDLTFHLERLHALAEAFMEGQIPHRIQTSMLNGYGYANPLFYGEFFLSIPAALYCLYVPLQTCYKIYAVLLNIATCLISYHCFTKMSKDWKIGIVTSFLYTASAYRLIDIFVRADVGEYTAMTFLPLVVYGFYQLYTVTDEEKIPLRTYLPIVLGLSGIIQCHILTCYMLAVFIPLFVLICWKKTFKKNRFFALVKSVILTALLNLWFIVPLFQSMQMDIKVTKAGTMGRIEKYGASFTQIFSIFHTATGNSIWDGVKAEMPLTVGIGLMSSFLLFCIWCFLRDQWEANSSQEYLQNVRIIKISFFLSCAALFFASAYCPWDALAVWNPKIDQVLGTIQFSWRYLEMATIILAVLMVFLLKIATEKCGKRTTEMIILGITLVALLSEGYFITMYANESDYKKYYAESELARFDVGSGMEYILYGTDTEGLNTNQVLASDGVTILSELQEQKGIRSIQIENTTMEDALLDLPVLAYENYVAWDQETKERLPMGVGENNRIRILIPTGYQGVIQLQYQEPLLWRILEVIAICTFLCILVIYRKKNKRSNGNALETENQVIVL